jgi:hypothetical protein
VVLHDGGRFLVYESWLERDFDAAFWDFDREVKWIREQPPRVRFVIDEKRRLMCPI